MPIPYLFVQQVSGDFVWGKNKIIHTLQVIEALGQMAIIEIRDKDDNSLVTLKYPIDFTSGYISVDLQPILRGLKLTTQRPLPKIPGLSTFLSLPWLSNTVNMVKVYSRLSSWAAPGTLTTKYVIDGGWDDMNFEDSGKQNNYIPPLVVANFYCNKGNLARILSHVPTNRLMDASEHGWISYIQEKDAIAGQKIQYQVQYNDFTWMTIDKTFSEPMNKTVWHIPVGIAQVGLDPSSKGIKSCTVTVMGTGQTLASYSLRYDYRPCYTWLDIHYRNSLGGWDFFRFRDNIEFSTDVERKEFDIRRFNNMGSNNHFDSQMRLKWKAYTGYISQQHMIALNDLLNSTDVCMLFENKWLPLKCMTKALKWNDARDGLHNELFEFETAGKFSVIPQQLLQFFSQPSELR